MVFFFTGAGFYFSVNSWLSGLGFFLSPGLIVSLFFGAFGTVVLLCVGYGVCMYVCVHVWCVCKYACM